MRTTQDHILLDTDEIKQIQRKGWAPEFKLSFNQCVKDIFVDSPYESGITKSNSRFLVARFLILEACFLELRPGQLGCHWKLIKITKNQSKHRNIKPTVQGEL